MSFCDGFYWGAATAAYQIEGAAFVDGRGLSVWDMMCRKPGAIYERQAGDQACDHYHRFKEDVAIMKQIGLKAYRMSLSWSRLIPEGTGKINPKGLEFYSNLFDELLKAGITPFVTLFHWDFPYDIYCRGGWLNQDSPIWFAEYAKIVMDNFSDRVTNWITFNEPQVFIGLGHLEGIHAPGDKLGLKEVLRAAHNVLLSHGRAVQVMRASAKQKPSVGFAPVGVVTTPASTSKADIDAARTAMFRMVDPLDWNVNTWWMDPVFFGRYPEDGLKVHGSAAPDFTDADMQLISQPLDFLGMNTYHGPAVSAGLDGTINKVKFYDGYPITAYPWPVTPEVLYWGPKFFYERYKTAIIVTENGMANVDWISLDGKVHDPQRIDLTHRYLLQLKKAAAAGIPVNGYFHWSLMDNFEWAVGFSKRFGLVYVDYPTQKRILKDSAYWYKDVIKSNGTNL